MSAAAPASARDVLARYRADPTAFCEEVLHFTPWSKQAAILESVRDHTRTSVRSCHGAGKTATAARAALWFLAVHPSSRVITTAPTWRSCWPSALVARPKPTCTAGG
jgi:phage terminase large subunit